MSRRVRIVYLAHAFMVGGAEEMVLNLVRHLPPRFEPMVCCINQAGPIGEEIRATGVPFSVLNLNPGVRRPFDVIEIRRYLRDLRPDIVHTFLLTASLYGRLAALLARVPIVIGTEVNIYERKRASHALAERLLMAGTDRVIVSAASVRDFYARQVHADRSKIDVVYNAVDFAQTETTADRASIRNALGLPVDAAVAGVIARLTEQKGHRFLFDALARTPGLSEVHLLVVGGGELESTLRHQVQTLGLEPRVHFVGPRRDLGNLLAAIDVFVMPSLWEGLPLSLVLAMGAARPSVATRVAGIPEIVEDGRTGMLVPPADVAALGSALATLVADASLRARMGRAASDAVRPRFNIERYVAAITGIYDSLLAAKMIPQPAAV